MEREFYNIFECAILLEVTPQTVKNVARKLNWEETKGVKNIRLYPAKKVESEAKRRVGEKARLQSMGLTYSSENGNAERKKKLRKERKLKGLCQTCGKSKEQENKSVCNYCLNRVREYGKTDEAKRVHERGRKKRNATAYGMWRRARDTAPSRKLEFNLDKEDIVIPDNCPLLDIPLIFGGERYNSPSLDRIDNNKGYIKGNVWVISDLANRMKQNASIEQLITFSKNVLSRFDT